MVEWLQQLSDGANGWRLTLGWGHSATGKLSVLQVVNGYLFQSMKDMATKGEGWALPFIHCPRHSGPLMPTALLATRLQ